VIGGNKGLSESERLNEKHKGKERICRNKWKCSQRHEKEMDKLKVYNRNCII